MSGNQSAIGTTPQGAQDFRLVLPCGPADRGKDWCIVAVGTDLSGELLAEDPPSARWPWRTRVAHRGDVPGPKVGSSTGAELTSLAFAPDISSPRPRKSDQIESTQM